MPRSLLDAFHRLGPVAYDWMYAFRAPWESGPRPALIELCASGRISPVRLSPDGVAPGRAIDLGCGSGADSIYLARQGFEVTGVDYSAVALCKAEDYALGEHLLRAPRFVRTDLLELPSESVPGPFDLLFDGGTLDDLPPAVRPGLARSYSALARPGAVLVLWCFYAPFPALPRFSLSGPSRWGAPPVAPGEMQALFGEDWEIERFVPASRQSRTAVFVLTRR